MRIIEGDKRGRRLSSFPFDIDIFGRGVMQRENVRSLFPCVAFVIQACLACDRHPADGDTCRREVESQHIDRIRVEGRIRDAAGTVSDPGNDRQRSQQMRLVCWRPLGNRPVHHAARAVGEFIGEPPLVAEGCVSLRG